MKRMSFKGKKGRLPELLLILMLLGLSAIAVVRSLIIGLDIDEQYAVTLAYRLAEGDIPVKEVWEPHQLSALLPALFVRIFLSVSGDSVYLVLYLRMVGLLFQTLVSVCWYCVMRHRASSKIGFITAMIVFHTLPKGILTPEFANQQIWFLVMLFLCVLQYDRTCRVRYCAAAGCFMILEVLAYPSCALLFPIYIGVLWQIEKTGKPREKRHKGTALFTLECFATAAVFLIYLLCRMSFSELCVCIRYIFSDGEHSAGMAEKLISYAEELPEIIEYLLVYALVAGLLCGVTYLVQKFQKPVRRKTDPGMFYAWLLAVALADQIRLWALRSVANVHPQIYYLILFGTGGIIYRRYYAGRNYKEEKLLFWGGWVPSLFALLSVLLLTNLDIKASLVHLFPGVMAAFFLWREKTDKKSTVSVMMLVWCLTLVGSRTMLVRDTGENKTNVFLVKQKVLAGAAKNIYAPYMTGYTLNAEYEFLTERLPEGSRVWYLGYDTLLCLIKEQQICGASTISTPVYDQRYLDYFEINPEKTPDYIVADRELWENDSSVITPEVRAWIGEKYIFSREEENAYCLIGEKKGNDR